MDSRYLTKDFIREFIDVYREHPALWKVKSKEYLKKNLKRTGTLALIEVCKRYNVDADKDFVTKKIQSMRGPFLKELKKVNDSRRSGSATEDVYVPTLWYYDLLSFIADQETMSESLDNINYSPELHTTPNGPKRSVGKKRSHEETTSDFMEACIAAMSTPQQPSLGEFDVVGIIVASKLSKMNSVQQVYAEFLIQKVLKLGALQKLNDQTDVAATTIGTVHHAASR